MEQDPTTNNTDWGKVYKANVTEKAYKKYTDLNLYKEKMQTPRHKFKYF